MYSLLGNIIICWIGISVHRVPVLKHLKASGVTHCALQPEEPNNWFRKTRTKSNKKKPADMAAQRNKQDKTQRERFGTTYAEMAEWRTEGSD